jgi:phage shock protein PspC (stress-responsive transcriptional regulator)
VTPNRHAGNVYRDRRHPDALLAGVCADLAQRLGWKVWAIRAIFVIGLFIKAIAAAAVYVILALLLPHLRGADEPKPGLSSPELSSRNERIADLEKRFRDLENGRD